MEDFRQLDSSAGIKSRAQIIHRVYLKKNAAKPIDIDEKVMSNISDQLYSEATCNIFNCALQHVMDRIRKIFRKQFLLSKEYNEYWELMQQTS